MNALDAVRARIASAAATSGRESGDICLIAVSKTIGVEAIRAALGAGQRHFGENRVQEAKAKWPELRLAHPDVRLHLIGPLQTNKARDAVVLFDAIHTLDRDRLAAALAKAMAETGRNPRLFVQVNIGEEPQKAGIAPGEASAFVLRCRSTYGLSVAGLMCIPPVDDDPLEHFAMLRDLADNSGITGLSMGMSGDFEAAIAAGATHVRVGSALFGAR